jgi:hypothetical protein
MTKLNLNASATLRCIDNLLNIHRLIISVGRAFSRLAGSGAQLTR